MPSRLQLQQQHERKRQAILNGGQQVKSEDIISRRASRETPELMMIEDDAFSRRLVENVLQKQYSITGLGEATLALETYARIAPDLLFLDIDLPDVTGHELLEKILKLDPNAYVIMLSGNCDRENITQAMSKGAKGFVAKPFTRDKLFQYITRCPTIHHQKESV
jgi:two-component system chemotaxis response regulator CheY